MAVMKMYVVFDAVAEESGPIFEAKNHDIAMRNYRRIVENVPSVDQEAFRLVYIGDMDKETMAVKIQDVPEVMGEGTKAFFVEKVEKDVL